ncbi:MAG: hypothetical protein K5739_03395 [Lachnospiraceae bacterium]|nr:hypothetical protein [Lachnospiraceae bacterium]
MKVTTYSGGIRISVSSEELEYIMNELDFPSITDMVNIGMQDVLEYIEDQLIAQTGKNFFEEIDDLADVNVMIVNGIMLIEIPNKKEGSDVCDNPRERTRQFIERLRDAIEAEMNGQNDQPSKALKKKDSPQKSWLYSVKNIGEALTGAGWVKEGQIIRWKGNLYIKTSEMPLQLSEFFDSKSCPAGMQPDEVICKIRDGKAVKKDE